MSESTVKSKKDDNSTDVAKRDVVPGSEGEPGLSKQTDDGSKEDNMGISDDDNRDNDDEVESTSKAEQPHEPKLANVVEMLKEKRDEQLVEEEGAETP